MSSGRLRPAPTLSQAEMRRFLQAPDLRSPVGYRDRALFEIIYSAGLGPKEVFRLRATDVALRDRLIHVGRGRRRKAVPLPPAAVGYAREYIEKIRPRWARLMRGGDDGTLFLNYTGSRLNPDTLRYAIERTARAAGMAISAVKPATFRRSLAAHLAENGMERRSIAEFLGSESQ